MVAKHRSFREALFGSGYESKLSVRTIWRREDEKVVNKTVGVGDYDSEYTGCPVLTPGSSIIQNRYLKNNYFNGISFYLGDYYYVVLRLYSFSLEIIVLELIVEIE